MVRDALSLGTILLMMDNEDLAIEDRRSLDVGAIMRTQVFNYCIFSARLTA
jgi:hypothetical protein